jgi:hypothetical protein
MVNRSLSRIPFVHCMALLVSASLLLAFDGAAQEGGRPRPNLEGFQQLQTRLATLNVNGVPLTSYHLAKAQAWLEFSKEEYFDNDRSGIVDSAFAEAVKLIDQLESGVTTPIEMTTPLLEGAARLDVDSWEAAEEFKKEKLDCAGHLIARLADSRRSLSAGRPAHAGGDQGCGLLTFEEEAACAAAGTGSGAETLIEWNKRVAPEACNGLDDRSEEMERSMVWASPAHMLVG